MSHYLGRIAVNRTVTAALLLACAAPLSGTRHGFRCREIRPKRAKEELNFATARFFKAIFGL
jgi:hypothetical protein